MVADAAASFHRMKAEGLLITRRFERWLLKRARTVLRRRFSPQERPVKLTGYPQLEGLFHRLR